MSLVKKLNALAASRTVKRRAMFGGVTRVRPHSRRGKRGFTTVSGYTRHQALGIQRRRKRFIKGLRTGHKY